MAEQSQSNRTEADPAQAEVKTAPFQHLAPPLEAPQARKGAEPMVTVSVPRAFNITLSDGTRQRVHFPEGNYPIPERLSKHHYLKANGVTVLTAANAEPPKPELEGPAPADDAAAWPSDDELEKAKFSDLGMILQAHGMSDDDIKALKTKDDRLAKVKTMKAAAEAAETPKQ